MKNTKQLCEFLVKAKKVGYASGDKAKKIKEAQKKFEENTAQAEA